MHNVYSLYECASYLCSIKLARGFVSKWYTRPEVILDLVPVDHVVNAMIAGAWQRGVTHSNQMSDGSEGVKRKEVEDDGSGGGGWGKPVIYHVSTSYDNPFTIQQLGMSRNEENS